MAYPPAPVPTIEMRVRPNGWWYLAVVALWLGGIGLVISVIATGVRIIDHGVDRVPATGIVNVPSGGLTVYASYRPSDRTCTLLSPANRVQLNEIGYDLNATIDGQQVYAIATTPSETAAGLYRLTCQGLFPGSSLWTGDKIPIASIALRAIVATGCFLAGLAVLIVLLVKRSGSKRRIRQLQMAPYGYPGGPTAPGWGGPAPYPYGAPPSSYGSGQPPQTYAPPSSYPPAASYPTQPPPPYPQQPPSTSEPPADDQPTGYDEQPPRS